VLSLAVDITCRTSHSHVSVAQYELAMDFVVTHSTWVEQPEA